MQLVIIIAQIVIFILIVLSLYAAFISLKEKEKRAAYILLAFSAFLVIVGLALLIGSVYFVYFLSLFILIITFIISSLFFIPIKRKSPFVWTPPNKKIDERDIIFSRNKLKPGSKLYQDYYKSKPENELIDNQNRNQPGLLSTKSTNYHGASFLAADSNFSTIDGLIPYVDGKIADQKQDTSPNILSNYLKSWAKSIGAHSVGITLLKDYHKYSHVGRGNDYGKEVNISHKYAIAITYEMKKELIDSAPKGPATMESSQVYLSSGTIAIQLANFIRGLGYSARAHIDSNYRVICPLVARDAGLGEIGRMSLLITPKLGSRVRIAAVTTDIELTPCEIPDNNYILDFCSLCEKCVDNCPTSAIPKGKPKDEQGVTKWQLNANACFSFWTISGTDCGRCISVCPFSHEYNLLHNFIRWGIKNNFIFARAAVILDDIFYGKKPNSREIPEWLRLN